MAGSKQSEGMWKGATFVLAGILIGLLLSGGGGFNLLEFLKGDPEVVAAKEYVQESSERFAFYDENQSRTPEGLFMIGNPDAAVKVVEFSDFQCPFCKRFFDTTLSSIHEQYIATGVINFVYKDLPLSFHANAAPAAVASHCAGEQEKFWQMHDVLFNFQDNWSESPKPQEKFLKYAKALKLNVGDFETCLEGDKYQPIIMKSLSEAQALGATGTPTFIIGNQTVVGAQPLSAFQQAILVEQSGVGVVEGDVEDQAADSEGVPPDGLGADAPSMESDHGDAEE